jgi:hypothetical protein
MNPKTLRAYLCRLSEIKSFVEAHHYSRSVKGITSSFCFRVMDGNQMVGAAIFGRPAMKDQITKYSENGKFSLIELRRFVMLDDAPRNSESRVLGYLIRCLAKEGVERILSYSDPSQGHIGVIYKAVGFEFIGRTPDTKVIWWKGRHYSHRSINRCDNYTRTLSRSSLRIRAALATGAAVAKSESGKFVYLKNL